MCSEAVLCQALTWSKGKKGSLPSKSGVTVLGGDGCSEEQQGDRSSVSKLSLSSVKEDGVRVKRQWVLAAWVRFRDH